MYIKGNYDTICITQHRKIQNLLKSFRIIYILLIPANSPGDPYSYIFQSVTNYCIYGIKQTILTEWPRNQKPNHLFHSKRIVMKFKVFHQNYFIEHYTSEVKSL